MSQNAFTLPSKNTVFLLLMAGSALLLAVPTEYVNRPVAELTQIIAPAQWAFQQATLIAARPIRDLNRQQMTAEEQGRLDQANKGLENQNVVLRQRVETLERTVRELSMFRKPGHPGDGLIIPAEIIAGDAAPRQDSFLVSQGKLRGVKAKDWVASRLFVQAGKQDGVTDNAAVLASECLIGWVEQSATFTSRVVLLSDPTANRGIRTHINHYDDKGEARQVQIDKRAAEFVLRGAGAGKMIIGDIKSEFIKAGVIAKGDLVLSDEHDPKLGQSLVIGEIEEVRQNREHPLLYEAIVRHRFDPRSLNQVLIVDRSRTQANP